MAKQTVLDPHHWILFSNEKEQTIGTHNYLDGSPGIMLIGKKQNKTEEFPGGPVVGTLTFTAEGLGSIPGWGNKIPQAVQPK